MQRQPPWEPFEDTVDFSQHCTSTHQANKQPPLTNLCLLGRIRPRALPVYEIWQANFTLKLPRVSLHTRSSREWLRQAITTRIPPWTMKTT